MLSFWKSKKRIKFRPPPLKKSASYPSLNFGLRNYSESVLHWFDWFWVKEENRVLILMFLETPFSQVHIFILHIKSQQLTMKCTWQDRKLSLCGLLINYVECFHNLIDISITKLAFIISCFLMKKYNTIYLSITFLPLKS